MWYGFYFMHVILSMSVYTLTCALGEGLFARVDVGAGAIVSLYNGVRITHDFLFMHAVRLMSVYTLTC